MQVRYLKVIEKSGYQVRTAATVCSEPEILGSRHLLTLSLRKLLIAFFEYHPPPEQALPWVRYITTAGEYEIRMG